MATTVAFLGLGSMGRPMAVNLAAAGFLLRLWNRTRGKGAGIDGAREFSTPREAAQGAALAVTMLADDAAVETTVLGDDGLAQGLSEGAVHVGCSTISPALARKLTALHAGRNQHYVGAPVFGRPDVAAARQLFVIPGGNPDALERCRPLFAALGQAGPAVPVPEQASLIKVVGNFFIASMIEMMSEGLALAEKAGVDPKLVVDILGETRIGSPVLKGYGATIASTRFEPALFGLPLGLKDVSLALEAGRALQVPLPLASLLRDHFLSALAKGRDRWDWTGMASVVRESAGLPATR
jgi:3-hydroxyisobutyrate dehydrogenase-like beta-hydroxyacid dehydrogenase